MDIYPSIMKASAKDIADYISSTLYLFPRFQIDIADGTYVDSKTALPEDLYDTFEEALHNGAADTFSCEFHLMVDDFPSMMPAIEKLQSFITIDRIIVHYGPLLKWLDGHSLEHAPNLLKGVFGFSFGLVLNPEEFGDPNAGITNNSPGATNPFINRHDILSFDCIQIMTVNPGAQGQSIIPSALEKTVLLRSAGYEGHITLDGAMNNETLPMVLTKPYQPDAICPGSYLEEDTENRLRILREIVDAKQ